MAAVEPPGGCLSRERTAITAQTSTGQVAMTQPVSPFAPSDASATIAGAPEVSASESTLLYSETRLCGYTFKK